MHKKKLLIFPYNGNGIEALDCVNENEYEFIGFIDDTIEKQNSQNPYPVYDRSILNIEKEAMILAVVGSATSYTDRKNIINSFGIDVQRFATIIHSSAKMGKQVTIGKNTLIMAGVVITSNAKIGNHICVLPNTVIHHDTVIEDDTLIGSNVVIAGNTVIEQNCYIGSGSNIINGIRIGKFSLIGMGSNVTKSVLQYSKMVGNPAKAL
jgi:sugar O-acyltransferase (sialic acid O-acetyltransferase NeuD family)